MDWFRLRYTIGLMVRLSPTKRATYLKKHNVFEHIGDNCMFMFRKLPLFAELISVGNNVHIASNVSLCTHDVAHNMLNIRANEKKYKEYVGCIQIDDNVFVGANTTILYNTHIPSDTIIGADSVVNKSLPHGGVWAGVPARYICSLEEFIKKREAYDIDFHRGNHGLDPKLVEACWAKFRTANTMQSSKEM